MTDNLSRRDFLKLTGVTGGAFILAGCSSGQPGERSFLNRLQGIPQTQLPQIEGAWTYQKNTLTLDLSKLPELADLGGAVRIEGDILTDPILIVLGEDSQYYAFKNACTHAGRKIDPVSGTLTLECCSVSGSTYDYEGQVLSGPAQEPLTSYPVSVGEKQIIISLG